MILLFQVAIRFPKVTSMTTPSPKMTKRASGQVDLSQRGEKVSLGQMLPHTEGAGVLVCTFRTCTPPNAKALRAIFIWP